MIIGITGCTGSGKTTALQVIRDLGGTIIDCDKVYHDLLLTDTALLSAIENRFPGTTENGVLNRKKLGAIVFSDENALKDLNRITHSTIKKAVTVQIAQHNFVAIDAIELFDGGLAKLCDVTVAITAPESARIARLTKRDSITAEQALMRIRAQKEESYFREKCDYILENNQTQADFRQICLTFFQDLLSTQKP